MVATPTLFLELVSTASKFASLFPSVKFVAAYAERNKLTGEFTGRKAPCKPKQRKDLLPPSWEWTQGVTLAQLQCFPSMEMLAVLLENHPNAADPKSDFFFVFDCDGYDEKYDVSSIDLYEQIKRDYRLKDTFSVTSGTEGHRAYFYRTLEPLARIPASPSKKLEFWAKNRYQVIAGKHPSGRFYESTGFESVDDFAILPREFYSYEAPKLEPKIKRVPYHFINFGDGNTSDHPDLETIQVYLSNDPDLYDPDSEEDWVMLGMIIKAASDQPTNDGLDYDEEGFQIWVDWSSTTSRDFSDEGSFEDICRPKWERFKPEGASVGSLVNRYKELKKAKSHFLDSREPIGKLETVDTAAIAIKQSQPTEKPQEETQKPLVTIDPDADLEALKQRDTKIAQSRLLDLYQRHNENEALDIRSLVGKGRFGQFLADYAEELGYPGEFLFMTALVAFTSQLPKGLTLRVQNREVAIPSLFLLSVMISTYGKGRIEADFKAVIEDINGELKTAHQQTASDILRRRKGFLERSKQDQADALIAHLASENMTEQDVLDVPAVDVIYPKKSLFPDKITYDVTPESLKLLSALNKKSGLLLASVEFNKFFNSGGRYSKSGFNSTVDDLIEAYDGGSTQSTRKSELMNPDYESIVAPDRFQLSLLSGIQPGRLKKIMPSNDESGVFGRFLYHYSETDIEPKVDDSDLDLYSEFYQFIYPLMAGCAANELGSISRKNPLETNWTPSARQLWKEFEKECKQEAKRWLEDNEPFFQVLRRMGQNCSRIALALHAFYCHDLPAQVDSVDSVSTQTVEAAIAICRRRIRCARFALGAHDPEVNSEQLKLFKDFIAYCNGKPLVYKDHRSCSIFRREITKRLYCEDKHRITDPNKWLKVNEVRNFWKDLEDHNFGTFDAKAMIFTPTV